MGVKVSQTSTAADKQTDVQDKLLGDQKKSELEGVGNEITLLLMDQQLSEDDKQLASELSQTVNLAKESEVEKTMEVDGTLLNDQEDETAELEGQQAQNNAPLTEQLGQQMDMKVDVTQPSFAVVPVPQAPAPAHRRSGFVRFIKAVMSFLTGGLVVRSIAKWKHKSKSTQILAAARERAEQLAARVKEHAPEGERENPQVAQALDFRTDEIKVPIIWEEAQGYGTQQPSVEAHAQQAEAGSRAELGGIAHSFIVLRYSKVDYRTNKERRYRLAFGFYPRTAIDSNVENGYNVTIPATLSNDSNTPSTAGRSYNVTPEQINTIINEAPKEEGKGYNSVYHNCTTYVVNLLKAAGLADPGIQEEYLDLGKSEMLLPAAKTKGGFKLDSTRDTLLSRMNRDDFSYGREGKKLVDYEDIERFESSMNFEEKEFVGYGPGMLGEQLYSINANDTSRYISYYTVNSIGDRYNTDSQRKIISLYQGAGKEAMATKLKNDIHDPINQLAARLSEFDAPQLEGTTEEVRSKNSIAIQERNEFLRDVEGFETKKNGIQAAMRDLLSTEEAQNDVLLKKHTYVVTGQLAAVESAFYKKYNEYALDKFGVENGESDLKAVLEGSQIRSNELDNNPFFLKAFARIFGTLSYAQYKQRKAELVQEYKEGRGLRELSLMSKKYMAVMDYYSAEQYKFKKFSGSASFSQEQINGAFGKPAQEGKDAERIQNLYANIVLSKLFPGAKNAIVTETEGYQLTTSSKGKKRMNGRDCCNISYSIAKIAEKGIDADTNGLFNSVVLAVAASSGNNPSVEGVTQRLLDSLFGKFFLTITEGTLVPVDFIYGLADANKFHSTVKKLDEFSVMNEARSELVAKITAIVAKVLDSMQKGAA